MLRGPDLRLDDLDGQILLFAADQAGDTVPAAHGALVRVHAGIRSDIPARRKSASEGILSRPLAIAPRVPSYRWLFGSAIAWLPSAQSGRWGWCTSGIESVKQPGPRSGARARMSAWLCVGDRAPRRSATPRLFVWQTCSSRATKSLKTDPGLRPG